MPVQTYGLTTAQLQRINNTLNRVERMPRPGGAQGRSNFKAGGNDILMGVVASTIKYDSSASPSTYAGTFTIYNVTDPSNDSLFAVTDTNYTSTEGAEGGEDTHSEFPLEIWPWCFPDCTELAAGHQLFAVWIAGRYWVLQADECPTPMGSCGGY